MIPSMDFESAIKASARAISMECRKRGWPEKDDLRQDMLVRIWLMMEQGDSVTRKAICYMARGIVVDTMRKTLGRSKIKSVHLSESEWEDIEDKKATNNIHVTSMLDDAEDHLTPDERLLFRHLRLGHTPEMIAKAIGMNIYAIRRDIDKLLANVRTILSGRKNA